MAEELLFERFGLKEEDETLFVNLALLVVFIPFFIAFISSIGSDLTVAQEIDNDPAWVKLVSAVAFFVAIFTMTISTLSVAVARNDYFVAVLLLFSGGFFAIFMYSLYTTDSERPLAETLFTFTVILLLLIFATGIGEL